MDWKTAILLLAGLFFFSGGFFNWGWLMRARRSRRFIGRSVARVIYMIVGLLIIVVAALRIAGVLEVGFRF